MSSRPSCGWRDQRVGEYASFDHGDGHLTLLVAYRDGPRFFGAPGMPAPSTTLKTAGIFKSATRWSTRRPRPAGQCHAPRFDVRRHRNRVRVSPLGVAPRARRTGREYRGDRKPSTGLLVGPQRSRPHIAKAATTSRATSTCRLCRAAANEYDRAVGFFSSAVFVIAWPGLREFVGRGGRMRVLCSAGPLRGRHRGAPHRLRGAGRRRDRSAVFERR